MAKIVLGTVFLLICSNAFMTYAWYGHLKFLKGSFWFWAVLISWGIAFFEYMLQVPANRLGARALSVPQLKIIQEVIALSVFIPFSIFVLKQKISLNYLWACLCVLGAVFFVFRD